MVSLSTSTYQWYENCDHLCTYFSWRQSCISLICYLVLGGFIYTSFVTTYLFCEMTTELITFNHLSCYFIWELELVNESQLGEVQMKQPKDERKIMPDPCSGKNLLTSLVTDYIQKRRGEPGLFSFGYNSSPIAR